MGTILKAICNCGYENDKIYFGAAMDDEGKCYVPALKNGSSEIEMKNIRLKKNYSDYVFYTEKLLFENTNISEKFNAWEYMIHKENNFCPKCKNYDLIFNYIGEFD